MQPIQIIFLQTNKTKHYLSQLLYCRALLVRERELVRGRVAAVTPLLAGVGDRVYGYRLGPGVLEQDAAGDIARGAGAH